MAKARGSIYRKRKLERLPCVVECPVPNGGLRSRFDDMDSWARRTCGNDAYRTTAREELRGTGTPTQILRVHFADDQTARAFALRFGLPYPAE